MSTCIFPGRFQPFHEGHLMVVQGMVKTSNSVYIVICEGKDDGPFTASQRREMISAALLAVDIMDASIVEVVDKKTDVEWMDAVLDVCGNPTDPQIWSGNDEVRAMFETKGVATKKIVHVPNRVSTEIRALIEKRDPSWRAKIPAGAVDVIEDAISKRQ
ncbi:MAG: adenylyltransferase/cytidyltransferase family protein [Candidatus Uhrbacteria bacterium]|nr:adenylyltransferase/cytidyltransferase family protein [Candidatus Uhrbacteria bacterium]